MNIYSFNHILMPKKKSNVERKRHINSKKKKITAKNSKNANRNGRKCLKNMESDNLSTTMQIHSKEHNGTLSETKSLDECGEADTENKDSILKTKTNNDDLKLALTSNEELKEMPQQSTINEYEFGKLKIVDDKSCEILANDNETLASPEIIENGNLACANNCVCFYNEDDAHHVLSIVKNGFLINHDSKCDNESENDDDNEAVSSDNDIKENDLPNYSRSCVYEERIIDFENFRIIEQVIDNNCEGKHTAANDVKCRNVKECKPNKEEPPSNVNEDESNAQVELPSGSKSTPIYVNPSLNFSCSELVAFIGESYQVIDNAQALYKSDKTTIKPKKTAQCKTKESNSVGNSPFKRSRRSAYVTNNTSLNRSVDDNNNTRRYTGITAAERLMQSLNCDVSRELTCAEKREVKLKSNKPNVCVKTPTPSKTLLKALKSKLTPLAPPFQPAANKNQEIKVSLAASASANSATLVNYEQTTIYYHHQQQQLQQQQQILANNMLQALCLNTPNQQHLMHQQQQVSPSQHQQQQLFLAQQHHHLQLQPPPPQYQHHHHQHQQHCAQHILAMTAASLAGQGMPHIHLPAAATATATTNNNNCNLSSMPTAAATVINVAATNPGPHHHQHLLPIHLIAAVGAGGGGVGAWSLLESAGSATNNATQTTPIYMDINGELRSICPAHGPPPTAVAITTPLAPMTNQAATSSSSNQNVMQQQNTVCLNPSQYPLTVTAQYHAAPQHQQQNHAQLHHHLQHLGQQHHQASLANSQNSPLRIKSNTAATAVASNCSSSATPSSSATAPRVVLQLDAGVSLPLQIAGKRKIFRGECTFYCNHYYSILPLV